MLTGCTNLSSGTHRINAIRGVGFEFDLQTEKLNHIAVKISNLDQKISDIYYPEDSQKNDNTFEPCDIINNIERDLIDQNVTLLTKVRKLEMCFKLKEEYYTKVIEDLMSKNKDLSNKLQQKQQQLDNIIKESSVEYLPTTDRKLRFSSFLHSPTSKNEKFLSANDEYLRKKSTASYDDQVTKIIGEKTIDDSIFLQDQQC